MEEFIKSNEPLKDYVKNKKSTSWITLLWKRWKTQSDHISEKLAKKGNRIYVLLWQNASRKHYWDIK